MGIGGDAGSRTGATSARRIVRRGLTVRLALFGVVISLIVFAGVYLSSEAGVLDGVRRQASSITSLVITTRHWNAGYGGVWVSKSSGAVSNPILRELGVDPDTRTVDGAVLTLRNPALMTREISELQRRESGVFFRLTSLDPVNLANTPDDWEAAQLRAFQDDDAPRETVVRVDGERVYRRITPLYADEDCLACHAVRGTRLGDVRGGISVTVPLGPLDERRGRDALWLGLIVLTGGATFIGFVDVTTRRTARQLEVAESELSRLATTDTLTGLANRRTVFGRLADEHERSRRTGHDYGLLVLDIDYFKDVNDTYGHACGDEVLEHLATRIRDSLRAYDHVGRIGGEEFLAIVPEAGEDVVRSVAARVLEAVRSAPVSCGDCLVSITISIGAAIARPGEEPDQVVARADAALYQAKREGRDRICFDESGAAPAAESNAGTAGGETGTAEEQTSAPRNEEPNDSA